MSDRAPDGVYVYQPHPVTRKDGRLWHIGGLPSGMTREEAAALAEAANRILSSPKAADAPGPLEIEAIRKAFVAGWDAQRKYAGSSPNPLVDAWGAYLATVVKR